jgi:bidirectional [NiFe] hydrogenase diaphorase subunit
MTIEGLLEAQRAETERQHGLKNRIMCCTAAGCISCGGEQVRRSISGAILARGCQNEVELRGTGCMGLCGRGPLVRTSSNGAVYTNVTESDAAALIEGSDDLAPRRIAPAEVVAEVKKSGLRGRGGAGYPTGLKWELVAKQASPVKYVICNADEGDPGAFMDRSVLEGDPHRVLEGMAIAGYAIGAKQGYIYVRGEYGLAIQRLQNAIKQAEREHLLGARILENDFQFRIDLRIGAGAFVCGEETALIASIEGRRGEPRQRPPYPPEKGLWEQPTLINNVETFANVPPIISKGGEWFASVGTASSKGTKVLALAGKISNPGLVEVPMGTSLRTIIYDIGGGIPGGGTFKAAQTGGPSGGCIPAEFLDLPVDYESLMRIGSIMGSGGLIVMDNSSCMVDVARFFMEFCMDESCGKCIPCRAGTVQMHDILKRMTQGRSRPGDLHLLEQLSDLLRETSLCGLGQTAPNPVLSTMRYFHEEYDAHFQDRRCPAGHCEMPSDERSAG